MSCLSALFFALSCCSAAGILPTGDPLYAVYSGAKTLSGLAAAGLVSRSPLPTHALADLSAAEVRDSYFVRGCLVLCACAFAATKGYVDQFLRSLHWELKHKGIFVQNQVRASWCISVVMVAFRAIAADCPVASCGLPQPACQ